MSKHDDIFGEIFDPTDAPILGEFKQDKLNEKRGLVSRRAADKRNEVGPAPDPTPEMLSRREYYKTHFVELHRDLFPDSTGVKPFGEEQQDSIRHGQDIFNKGSGRLLKLEPRGYAKTSRLTNEAITALLLGMQDYIVICCSSLSKAEDILESIKTELYNNEQLFDLFPAPLSCFRQLGDNPQRARYQTYRGNKTYIEWGNTSLQFPAIEGEPSSGKLIEVRPLTNVKGLHKKIQAGPDVGKIFRPTLFLFDDPQTHGEALSPTSVEKIVSMIKRDALKGGAHHRKAAAIMAITPVAPGDVAWWFEMNEHSWEVKKYKMLTKFPANHQWWMEEYGKVYLNYDRTVRGDRTRAGLEARKLLEDNWQLAHEDAEVTWEHAYGWDEEPQIEISPVQHAYHVILDDGWKDFEFECQCNTEYGTYQDGETINAPAVQILSKRLPYKRFQIPQDTHKLVAHIDVNKEILSYSVMCSPQVLRPHIPDYGTWPKQPGLFSKRNLTIPLSTIYPDISDYRERIYKGVQDIVSVLMDRNYIREDGVEISFSKIGIDIRYEEAYVTRAIKESNWGALLLGCSGTYVEPDDDLLHQKERPNAIAMFDNCYIEPNKSRTLDILHFDTNYFKTELHKGFNLELGVKGSASLYGKSFDGEELSPDIHLTYADHLNSEIARRKEGKKKKKTKICWEEKRHQADNEFFDNSTNCLALLISEGVSHELNSASPSQKKDDRANDMNDFLKQQSGKKLL